MKIDGLEVDEVIYYWYDHDVLYLNGEADKIEKIIEDHDFKTFMAYMKRYGWEYFPNDAMVVGKDEAFIGSLDITIEENFNKITRSEHECG